MPADNSVTAIARFEDTRTKPHWVIGQVAHTGESVLIEDVRKAGVMSDKNAWASERKRARKPCQAPTG